MDSLQQEGLIDPNMHEDIYGIANIGEPDSYVYQTTGSISQRPTK